MGSNTRELTQKEYEHLIIEHESFKHDIETLGGRVKLCEDFQATMSTLATSVDRLVIVTGNMVDEQKEIKEEVKSLKEAPLKEFNHYKKTIISCIITTVVGALVGALMTFVISGGA